MNPTSAESVVLNEFGCYFLADELLNWTGKDFEEKIPELAADSAERLWFDGEGVVPEVIALLRELSEHPEHRLMEEIGDKTLIEWRHAWPMFRLLVGAIIDELERLLKEEGA
jgi:hypothetical protein